MPFIIGGETFYTCGEVAKKVGKSPLTLRIWEKKGRIPPARRQKSSNWRLYTEEEIEAISALLSCATSSLGGCNIGKSKVEGDKQNEGITQLSKAPIPVRERLIVALDVPSFKAAKSLVEALGNSVVFYKIGLALICCGNYLKFIRWLKKKGKKVFVDLKFFDIPQTVAGAVRQIRKHGVDFVTVHGNDAALEAAVQANRSTDTSSPMKILAVTLLTSLDAGDIKDLGFHVQSVTELVLSRAKRALQLGCDGVVSSGLEVVALRHHLGDKILAIVPGIHPVANTYDQKRAVGIEEAFSNGADYVVMGRGIHAARNPAAAARKTQKKISMLFD